MAEHNLSFRTGDHFIKLVKSMFPDSSIANRFQCSRTKTSVLARTGNGRFSHDKVVETLTSAPVYYSLLVDESNLNFCTILGWRFLRHAGVFRMFISLE